MFDMLHEASRLFALHNETLWAIIVVGLATAGFSASQSGLAAWKGLVIGIVAILVAALVLPFMHPLWSHFASRGGAVGLSAGEYEHVLWIGVGACAALGAACVAGRLNARIAQTLWVVFVSGGAMWGTQYALTLI